MNVDKYSLPAEARTWLREIDRRLKPLPDSDRAELLDGLRGHFADTLSPGATPRDAISKLGSPSSIAEQAFQEYQDRTGIDPRPRFLSGKRVAQLIALALLIAGILTILIVPSYESVTSDSSGHQTVTENNVLTLGGPGLLATLAIPLVISAAPVLIKGPAWQPVSITAAVLLGVFTAIASFSFGLFFIPALIAEITAAFLPSSGRRGRKAAANELHNQTT